MIRRIAALSLFAALSGGFIPVSAEPVKQLLKSLPPSLGSNAEMMFSANPLGQLALNSRHQNTTLEALLARIRADLTKAGYCEEPIRTNVTRGTFSATWAPPKGTVVDGTQPGNYAVLSTQAVMLNPSVINLNVSFSDVRAGNQAVITECYGGSSGSSHDSDQNSNPSETETKSKPSAPSIKIKLF
ncbi:hypothetical protein MITS9509_01790 [Synechococcus sp. MIT S9509]|uniref:hypothetical protein n=1 Tax=Synechococcus sp. MIT S9509 TaxID=1801630 RepID=UPI0007BB8486|nr:hypothetical protein [Synechococcus sp. MIT S9509]KZR91869.1 hypothetical protein MITS9509_01790 [Synechococcus sp. MIT S9509]